MNIAKLIDHTILKANTTKEDVMKVIEEAKEYKFASVCINPTWVKLAAEELAGHDVDVCTVIGFPLGASTTETKSFRNKRCYRKRCNWSWHGNQRRRFKRWRRRTCWKRHLWSSTSSKGKALVKVIIETCLLTDEEKVRACELSVKAGADFVKTSTGFSTGGATAEDIALMRKTVGPNVGVKASGGVRTREDAEKW